MADSRREVILEAGKTSLQAGPEKPAGLNFYRHRTRPLQEDELPAGVILNGMEKVTRETVQPPIVECELIVRIEFRYHGEPSDEVLDPYLTYAVRRLQTDPVFLAIAGLRQVQERMTVWDQEPAKKPKAAAAVELAIIYRRKYGDPTQPA